MPRFAAVEAEIILDTTFSFLGGHLGDMYDINVHGIGVFGRFRWQGSMVVGLFGIVMLLGN